MSWLLVNRKNIIKYFVNIVISCFIFFTVLSNSELNNDYFNSILTNTKIILLSLLLLVRLVYFTINKLELFIMMLAVILGLTFDPYLITISFFILSGVAFSILFREPFLNTQILVCYSLFFSICIIFILYMLGYLDGYTLSDSSDFAIGDKKSFGFSHPNKASVLIVQCVLLAICFRYRFLIFLSLMLYVYTFFDLGGRTALGGILIFVLLYCIKFIFNVKKYIHICMIIYYVFFPLLLILFIVQGDWSFWGLDFNYITSTRLSLIKELYDNNGGLHFFPVNISGRIVDVGIVNFIIGTGLIIYLGYVLIINYYLKIENNINYIILIVSVECMNFMENFFNANMLISVILLARILSLIKYNSYYK